MIILPMKPTTLIIRTAGTNCDHELAHAFELAGSTTTTVHLNRLIERPRLLDDADLVGIPGGFSYGDDIAAGRIFANRLKHRLFDRLRAAMDRGVPMIGICNGFQVLVKMGLLPDPDAGRQTATLADNRDGRFIDRWVRLKPDPSSVCIWTRSIRADPETDSNGFEHGAIELPVAHGEGRFQAASGQLLRRWQANGQVALRYASDDNPNGSADDIAGICDATGLVLGMMPHPERCTHPTHHPGWTRGPRRPGRVTVGLLMFQDAVRHVSTGSPAAAMG